MAHDNGESPDVTFINENYVNSFQDKLGPRGTGLFLFGYSGSGKTWLAASIANELTDRGLRCKYTSLLKIVTDLNNMRSENKDRYLSQLWQVDLLVLDDFGMEAENNTSTNLLNLIAHTNTQNTHILCSEGFCKIHSSRASDIPGFEFQFHHILGWELWGNCST